MKHRSRPQAAKIERELQARRQAAVQAAANKKHEREMNAATSLVEREMGGVVL